ncbi:hypothetical protein PPSIR1_20839 [Plesiocystis pacifica SIR-1]|uniref:STAS/SEC14 domain-containing protein n=1 Tax=Plesiocystis pacifica SIR-1 TaxID=391625 RepID=A6GGT3_9BACT|nr:STAS/SEC14 domain-containing protein [Plesiocystis pacifica]EDM74930.1 hypothetical protein PPSIR1_20839 [Plesiocystis pacifica SIR-1]
MQHRVYRSDDGLTRVQVIGSVTPEDVLQVARLLSKLLAHPGPTLVLIDQSQVDPKFGRSGRRALETIADSLAWDRGAVIGSSHINRMLARIVLELVRQTERTRFFDTEADAVAWLLSPLD